MGQVQSPHHHGISFHCPVVKRSSLHFRISLSPILLNRAPLQSKRFLLLFLRNCLLRKVCVQRNWRRIVAGFYFKLFLDRHRHHRPSSPWFTTSASIPALIFFLPDENCCPSTQPFLYAWLMLSRVFESQKLMNGQAHYFKHSKLFT